MPCESGAYIPQCASFTFCVQVRRKSTIQQKHIDLVNIYFSFLTKSECNAMKLRKKGDLILSFIVFFFILKMISLIHFAIYLSKYLMTLHSTCCQRSTQLVILPNLFISYYIMALHAIPLVVRVYKVCTDMHNTETALRQIHLFLSHSQNSLSACLSA